MKILGISELDNDAGAALFFGSTLVGAVNEERFSRIKRHCGFPHRSVAWLLQRGGLKAADLDAVVIVKQEFKEEMRRYTEPLSLHNWLDGRAPVHEGAANWLAYRLHKVPRMKALARRLDREIQDWIRGSGIRPQKVFRTGHHESHAACAYFASGFEPCLAVTVDGQGAGVSAALFRCEQGRMERLHQVFHPNSMGVFYAAATKALGFVPARHEGKVTGLAGCGPATAELLEMCRGLAFNSDKGFETPCLYGAYPRMKKALRKGGRIAFAAAFQQVLEEVVCGFVRPYLQQTGLSSVALAGGVFANVKLNQRIKEIPGVERVFVFPHMCDGGLGYGGALLHLAETVGCRPEKIEHVYWGPEFEPPALEAALVRSGLFFKRTEDVACAVANLLAQGRTVARFTGALEFGPRALGHRSILYQTTDPGVNDWLNHKLRRSEFMPFAPITLPEQAPELYRSLEGGEFAARFMTITFDCTDKMKKLSPAVVHKDGTARPQIVDASSNRDLYEILRGYMALTGIPSLINTSFNMHEEPIVESPSGAIAAFVQAGLDCLAMGPFLCVRDEDKGLIQ